MPGSEAGILIRNWRESLRPEGKKPARAESSYLSYQVLSRSFNPAGIGQLATDQVTSASSTDT